jgi:aminoglycoside phosphotransferase (APT) family kinase protein
MEMLNDPVEHRALVERLFPQLDVRTFRRVGDGWTCDTYDVNGEWIVQVPRSAYAADALRAQIAILPELAAELSASIPAPELVSSDPPCMAYRRLDGVAAAAAPVGIWPERLGRFLYDLHMVPPEIVGMRGSTAEAVRAVRREEFDRLREVVLPLLEPDERARADAMLHAYLDDDLNWRFAPCLTHRDLGPEHVLVSPTGDLVGVLDWEEVGIDDPAWDFAWWLHERPEVGRRALAAYGGQPDERFRHRAWFVYALMPWHEVEHGAEAGDETFVRSRLEGIRERMP